MADHTQKAGNKKGRVKHDIYIPDYAQNSSNRGYEAKERSNVKQRACDRYIPVYARPSDVIDDTGLQEFWGSALTQANSFQSSNPLLPKKPSMSIKFLKSKNAVAGPSNTRSNE